MHTTVRITEGTRTLLKELAAREQITMQAVLEKALEEYRRRSFLESVNEGYAALQADPAARAQIEAERELWDHTLGDGLPAGDTWIDPAQVSARRAPPVPRARTAAKRRRK